MKTLSLLMALSLCASMSAQENTVEASTMYNFQKLVSGEDAAGALELER